MLTERKEKRAFSQVSTDLNDLILLQTLFINKLIFILCLMNITYECFYNCQHVHDQLKLHDCVEFSFATKFIECEDESVDLYIDVENER